LHKAHHIAGFANAAGLRARCGTGEPRSRVRTRRLAQFCLLTSRRAESRIKIMHQYSSRYACEANAPALALADKASLAHLAAHRRASSG
jgi:hypothetical protein